MRKRFVGIALLTVMVAVAGGYVAWAGSGVRMCHLTNGGAGGEAGRCLAVVIEVSPQAAASHAAHGDPPAPPGLQKGDHVMVACPQ